MRKSAILLACISSFAWAQEMPKETSKGSLKIGVVSDPHLHDIYPTQDSNALESFYNPDTKQYEFVRSFQGQMASTRLFNENYFAFRQALTDLVAQGVQFVLLSGDYTDDGQTLNLQATDKLLREFTTQHGIRFFITNGNHEAVNRMDRENGKSDFLTQDGRIIGAYSSSELLQNKSDIVYPPLRELGYESMYPFIKDYGLEPRETDLFYTTPFEPFAYESYSSKKANQQKKDGLAHRSYSSKGVTYPDFTYLVEPIQDVWILAIDGNMYNQVADNQFKNSSDGYHAIDERQYLLDWIKQVVSEAKQRGKRLIAFGHYPILDFNNQQSQALADLLGKDKFQLKRVPTVETQLKWVETGLPLHFAGHMHINQQEVKKQGTNTLWNIQVPSLAAFPPAYKTIEVKPNSLLIQTHILTEVEGYNTLFDLYKKEVNPTDYADFFGAENYYQLTKSHLKYLSEGRFYTADFADKKWNIYKEAATLAPFVSKETQAQLSKQSLDILRKLDFKTLVFDLYLIRNANDIGQKEIDSKRINLYKKWSSIALSNKEQTTLDQLVIIFNNMVSHHISTSYFELK